MGRTLGRVASGSRRRRHELDSALTKALRDANVTKSAHSKRNSTRVAPFRLTEESEGENGEAAEVLCSSQGEQVPRHVVLPVPLRIRVVQEVVWLGSILCPQSRVGGERVLRNERGGAESSGVSERWPLFGGDRL